VEIPSASLRNVVFAGFDCGNCLLQFRSVDVLVIGAVCKLRKIFSLQQAPRTDQYPNVGEPVPKACDFALGTEAVTHLLSVGDVEGDEGGHSHGHHSGHHGHHPRSGRAVTSARGGGHGAEEFPGLPLTSSITSLAGGELAGMMQVRRFCRPLWLCMCMTDVKEISNHRVHSLNVHGGPPS